MFLTFSYYSYIFYPFISLSILLFKAKYQKPSKVTKLEYIIDRFYICFQTISQAKKELFPAKLDYNKCKQS